MLTYNENMVDEMGASDEVTTEFQHMQERFGDDVSAHKAELGLDLHENFSLDEFMSQDEQDMLNESVEGTPEYKAAFTLFNNRLISHAFTEATQWAMRRAATITDGDAEKVLDSMLDVQEKMTVLMAVIAPASKKLDATRKDLDSWVKRFNAWKGSPEYKAYANKDRAYRAFFAGLDKRKAAHAKVKAQVAPELTKLWSMWNAQKSISDQIAKANPFVWTLYFNLVEEELNNYFTTGDTEDVDDFSLLANTQAEVIELLSWSHVQEMSAEDAPEATGVGYWNFRTEAIANYKNELAKADLAEEESFLEGLMNSEPTI